MRYLSYFLSTLIGNLLLKENSFEMPFLCVPNMSQRKFTFLSFLSVISSLNAFTHISHWEDVPNWQAIKYIFCLNL